MENFVWKTTGKLAYDILKIALEKIRIGFKDMIGPTTDETANTVSKTFYYKGYLERNPRIIWFYIIRSIGIY